MWPLSVDAGSENGYSEGFSGVPGRPFGKISRKRRATGRPTRLNAQQMTEVRNLYFEGARVWGYPTDRWTTARFARAIEGRRQLREDVRGGVREGASEALDRLEGPVGVEHDRRVVLVGLLQRLEGGEPAVGQELLG